VTDLLVLVFLATAFLALGAFAWLCDEVRS
jgi:hypothetical protein